MTDESSKYYVYALKSQVDGRIYVGFTNNLDRRLTEHNTGKTKSTKAYKPWAIIYTEECTSRIQARQREKYWKGGSGKEKLKALS